MFLKTLNIIQLSTLFSINVVKRALNARKSLNILIERIFLEFGKSWKGNGRYGYMGYRLYMELWLTLYLFTYQLRSDSDHAYLLGFSMPQFVPSFCCFVVSHTITVRLSLRPWSSLARFIIKSYWSRFNFIFNYKLSDN